MKLDNLLPQLILEFPRLFRYTEPRGRSEVYQGWYPFLQDLCHKIDGCLDDLGAEQFQILQIKEKIGSLRFYFRCTPTSRPKLEPFLTAAHEQSKITCLVCGKTGVRLKDQLHNSICPLCDAKLTKDSFKF